MTDEFEEFVKKVSGKITVDWEALESSYKHEGLQEQKYYQTIQHLIDLGILSPNPNGNFQVSDGSLNLNPRYRLCQLYFTRGEDAEAYKKAKFSGVLLYKVSIIKFQDKTG